jgi:hypothetical protein
VRPSYEIEVAKQARKPRKSRIRRPHAACTIFSFTHVIGWLVLRQCRKGFLRSSPGTLLDPARCDANSLVFLARVQRPFTLELSDRGRISGVTVGGDEPRGGKGLFLPRLWPEIVGSPRRPDWLREKNRLSRRWSQAPGTSTAIYLSLAHRSPRF